MPDAGGGLRTALGHDVSRETMARLEAHLALLTKWNAAINLVSPATIADAWTRHIVDSGQVFAFADIRNGHWVDFGTGGGFPGLVCAILARDLAPSVRFTFVESDKRKCAFLATAVQTLDIEATVRPERIETLPPLAADIVSARAVASLTKLIGYASPHLAANGRCLFPKGTSYRDEITAANRDWRFKVSAKPSITDPDAVILVVGDIERV